MQAKSKGAPVVEDPTPKGISIHDRRIDIQPAEDEEDPGKLSAWPPGLEPRPLHFLIMFGLTD